MVTGSETPTIRVNWTLMMEGRGDVKGRTLCYDMTLTVEQFKFFQSYVDRFRGIMLFNNIGYRWGSDVCDLSLWKEFQEIRNWGSSFVTYA